MSKVVLILGSSSDVGMAYMHYLEKLQTKTEKFRIIAHYNNMNSNLSKIIKSCNNISIDPFKANLEVNGDILKLINYIEANYNCPDYILHLPAKKLKYARIAQFDYDEMIKDLNIQLFSLMGVCRVFLPLMARKNFGKVIVLTSAVTLGTPPKFMSSYVTIKYALLGLVRSLAAEYETRGININAIAPNLLKTKFLSNLDETLIKSAEDSLPLRRAIYLEEVVSAIHFLFSENANCFSGVNMNLSGGEYM